MNALPVVLVILVVVGFVGLAIYLEHLRRQFWRDMAAKFGLTYHVGDPRNLHESFSFSLFQQGHSRRTSHTLEGVYRGLPVIAFDYKYTTGSGKNQSTHSLSALIATLPVSGRNLSARPENVADRFAAFFGFDDINFELEEFNRAFSVSCEDKKFAYDVFHPRMMEFCLSHRDLSLEWQGRNLLIYSWSKGTFDELELKAMLDAACGFAERLPEYLVAQQRG